MASSPGATRLTASLILFWLVTAVAAAKSLRVGSLDLSKCHGVAGWCGFLDRPLDPSGQLPGTLRIYFEYFPALGSGPLEGTLVATEGGPGFPATQSRDAYLRLFEPLRAHRDLVIMDNRGTGRSGALNCSRLQRADRLSAQEIGECGRSLGDRARFYTTAHAVDDLEDLLKTLGRESVDLYGDSYGTYFAQTFAVRHPQRLRSLILDGAYPLDGPDYAWYSNYAPAMRAKFNLVCQRSPGCNALPGDSLAHLVAALRRLREKPFKAVAFDGDGRSVAFMANATQLATVMFGSSPAYASVRELDAAARAFVEGDGAALLRLMAESLSGTDSRDATRSPQFFSAALAAAVTCQDPPQIFDMSLPVKARLVARNDVLARREAQKPDTYAPFTIPEYIGMPADYAFIDECSQWPAWKRGVPANEVNAHGKYPEVPVLVISGELDNMTSVADGAAAAGRFPHAHHVVIANSFHVNALPHARSRCGALIARQFIATLLPGDTSCAAKVPEVRLVPRFAIRWKDAMPASGQTGNSADQDQLRQVSVAVATLADVIGRISINTTGKGVGLRGGVFTISSTATGYRLVLHDVRWARDLGVTGTLDWPSQEGVASAQLQLAGGGGTTGALQVQWSEGVPEARATIRGTLGGNAVVAEAPAP